MNKVLLVIGASEDVARQREIKTKIEKAGNFAKVNKLTDLQGKGKTSIPDALFIDKVKNSHAVVILCSSSLKQALDNHNTITYVDGKTTIVLEAEAILSCMRDQSLENKFVNVYFDDGGSSIPKCLQGASSIKYDANFVARLRISIKG